MGQQKHDLGFQKSQRRSKYERKNKADKKAERSVRIMKRDARWWALYGYESEPWKKKRP